MLSLQYLVHQKGLSHSYFVFVLIHYYIITLFHIVTSLSTLRYRDAQESEIISIEDNFFIDRNYHCIRSKCIIILSYELGTLVMYDNKDIIVDCNIIITHFCIFHKTS